MIGEHYKEFNDAVDSKTSQTNNIYSSYSAKISTIPTKVVSDGTQSFCFAGNNTTLACSGYTRVIQFAQSCSSICVNWGLEKSNLDTFDNYKSFTQGNNHACYVLKNGDGYCYGNNNDGQLGTGDNTDSFGGFVKVTELSGSLEMISAGDEYGCVPLAKPEVSHVEEIHRNRLPTLTPIVPTAYNKLRMVRCWSLWLSNRRSNRCFCRKVKCLCADGFRSTFVLGK